MSNIQIRKESPCFELSVHWDVRPAAFHQNFKMKLVDRVSHKKLASFGLKVSLDLLNVARQINLFWTHTMSISLIKLSYFTENRGHRIWINFSEFVSNVYNSYTCKWPHHNDFPTFLHSPCIKESLATELCLECLKPHFCKHDKGYCYKIVVGIVNAAYK